jgi:hypothetical protein
MIEITKASALRMKPVKRPTLAMSTPATAGPTMRAVLNDAEFMPTALTRYWRPTSSMMKERRVGWSSAFITPHVTAMTATYP